MLTNRKCPECSADIIFSYKTPERSYRVEDGKIVSDDAWNGPIYEDPYFDFNCSEDKAHVVDVDSIAYERSFYEWGEEIVDEFTRKILSA
jgi:hypothetical protein